MKATKVLIIDDSPDVSNLLQHALRAQQIDSLVAGTGAQGLVLAHNPEVALVLLDLTLPDIDGLDVCERIHENPALHHLPILVMTGRDSMEDKVRAFELGASDYINKPFNLAEIQARVMAALRRRQSSDEEKASTRQEVQRTSEELRRISKAVDCASDAICILDTAGKATYFNFAFNSLFRLGLHELQQPGQLAKLFSKQDAWENIWEAAAHRKSWRGEMEIIPQPHRRIAVFCRADAIIDAENTLLGVVLIFSDISQRKRLEHDLLQLANHDPLTGLANQRHFLELLERSVKDAQQGTPGYLLYLDLDNFKVVNDSVGHSAGNRLLMEIAKLLKELTRNQDILARFGGDAFTILLHNLDYTKAAQVTQRLLDALDRYRFIEQGRTFGTSASIGVAAVDGSLTAEDILAQADSACNLVKSRGRNGYEHFQPHREETQQLIADAQWALAIKDALRDNRFELWLQPIQPLKGQVEVYFEVLVRMRDERGNIILPGAFIPAAERFGNMQQLDRFVIQQSINLLKAQRTLRLAVNLSARTLNDLALPEQIANWLEASGVEPERISFEITETAMIQNMDRAKQLILRIKGFGCHFALDDFGSGASSMTYLRDLPVDFLKIDGSFVQGVAHDPVNRALVKSMVEVARVLEKQTVAEAIMSEEVLAVVKELGIDYGQGMFLGKPAPATDFMVEGS